MALLQTVKLHREPNGSVSVEPVFEGTTRSVLKINCKRPELADRLKLAFESGKAIKSAELKSDANGDTIARVYLNFKATMLESELQRLGF